MNNSSDFETDFQKANQFVTDCKYDLAETILKKYIDKDPAESYYWNALGLTLRGLNRLNEAYDCFQKAISKQPVLLNAFYNLGRLEGECLSFHRREDIRRSHGLYNTCNRESIVYSCFDEQNVIQSLLDEIGSKNIKKYCVDIGASDGLTFSNTYPLFNSGWRGVCIECDPEKFADLSDVHINSNDVQLMNCFATPQNILDIFKIHKVPKEFGFLSLDIDSYDYYVLEKILSKYKPAVICAEINEYFPPPICFALKYGTFDKLPNAVGQSITMLNKLLFKNDYTLVHLEYNNAFAVHNSKLDLIKSYKSLTPEEAFRTGLVDKLDWKLKMPWFKEARQLIYTCDDKNALFEYIKQNVLREKFELFEYYMD